MKKLFSALFIKFPSIRKYFLLLINKINKQPLLLKYDINRLNNEYYQQIKNVDCELEHQIGRLTNFSDIILKCKKLNGDFIEFGTWKGFSLLWIAYFCDKYKMHNKKIVAIDSFEGLPYDDGIFKKYDFNDTTLKMCKDNIYKSLELTKQIKTRIYIHKSLFKDTNNMIDYIRKLQIKTFCFIHIDCDISQSAKEIFNLLTSNNLIGNKCYILFDDYGCDSNLRVVVNNWMKFISKQFNIKFVSKTKLTKNYLLIKK